MLEQLTILIPSFNRARYLYRAIRYYSNFPVLTLVIDGSEMPLSSTYPNIPLNCHYLHRPDMDLLQRLFYSIRFIKTPYVVMLGDDEFHLPSGLAKSIEVLESDPSIASAIGLDCGFCVRNQKVWADDFYRYKPFRFVDNLARRVENYFMHYSPTLSYAVWRSDCFSIAIKTCTNIELSSSHLVEFMHAFCGIVLGNHVIHDQMQWLRSSENMPEQSQLSRNLSIVEWYLNPSFAKEHKLLNQSLTAMMVKYLKISDEKSRLISDLSLNAYLYGQKQRKLLMKLGLTPSKNFHRVFQEHFVDYVIKKQKGSINSEELAHIQDAILSAY